MPVVQQSTVVPYSPANLYKLVNDIEEYATFLPWCKESRVLSRTEDEVQAVLVLSAGGFQKSFTTRNLLQKDKMIEIRLLDGPFKQLEGFWKFEETDSSCCRITLDLQFEFSNKLLELAFGSAFNQVVSTLMSAFCKRADEVYGKAKND